jgi:hypothetical protein
MGLHAVEASPCRAWIPCFQHNDSQVYLVMEKTLYSFTPLQVTPLKTLPQDMQSICGPSHYSRGTLYCSADEGAAGRLELGVLTSNSH